MSERILIVEDDDSLVKVMRIQLEHAGYRVSVCQDGPTALQQAQDEKPNLILLDVLLPEADGWSVCQRLQGVTNAPIVFTTALGTDRNLTHGLELGADDYIIKPFTRKELLSRVKAALHRARRDAPQHASYRKEHLFVDVRNRVVQVNGEPVSLTPLEFKLLAALVEQAGRVIPHAALLRHVWGPECENRRQYLKLYIWYLRQKLEADPANPTLILTERGVGYRLAAPD